MTVTGRMEIARRPEGSSRYHELTQYKSGCWRSHLTGGPPSTSSPSRRIEREFREGGATVFTSVLWAT